MGGTTAFVLSPVEIVTKLISKNGALSPNVFKYPWSDEEARALAIDSAKREFQVVGARGTSLDMLGGFSNPGLIIDNFRSFLKALDPESCLEASRIILDQAKPAFNLSASLSCLRGSNLSHLVQDSELGPLFISTRSNNDIDLRLFSELVKTGHHEEVLTNIANKQFGLNFVIREIFNDGPQEQFQQLALSYLSFLFSINISMSNGSMSLPTNSQILSQVLRESFLPFIGKGYLAKKPMVPGEKSDRLTLSKNWPASIVSKVCGLKNREEVFGYFEAMQNLNITSGDVIYKKVTKPLIDMFLKPSKGLIHNKPDQQIETEAINATKNALMFLFWKCLKDEHDTGPLDYMEYCYTDLKPGRVTVDPIPPSWGEFKAYKEAEDDFAKAFVPPQDSPFMEIPGSPFAAFKGIKGFRDTNLGFFSTIHILLGYRLRLFEDSNPDPYLGLLK